MYPATKTIQSAKPTIRTSDNVVIIWELVINFTYLDFSRTYVRSIELENPVKTTSEYTQQELLELFPILDRVFDAQYEHYLDNINNPVTPVATETVTNFDISTLS